MSDLTLDEKIARVRLNMDSPDIDKESLLACRSQLRALQTQKIQGAMELEYMTAVRERPCPKLELLCAPRPMERMVDWIGTRVRRWLEAGDKGDRS